MCTARGANGRFIARMSKSRHAFTAGRAKPWTPPAARAAYLAAYRAEVDKFTSKALAAERSGSHSTRLHVAEHITAATDEHDAVAGWIRLVPFELVGWDFNLRSDRHVRPAARFVGPVIGDAAERFVLARAVIIVIAPVGVGFTAT